MDMIYGFQGSEAQASDTDVTAAKIADPDKKDEQTVAQSEQENKKRVQEQQGDRTPKKTKREVPQVPQASPQSNKTTVAAENTSRVVIEYLTGLRDYVLGAPQFAARVDAAPVPMSAASRPSLQEKTEICRGQGINYGPCTVSCVFWQNQIGCTPPAETEQMKADFKRKLAWSLNYCLLLCLANSTHTNSEFQLPACAKKRDRSVESVQLGRHIISSKSLIQGPCVR